MIKMDYQCGKSIEEDLISDEEIIIPQFESVIHQNPLSHSKGTPKNDDLKIFPIVKSQRCSSMRNSINLIANDEEFGKTQFASQLNKKDPSIGLKDKNQPLKSSTPKFQQKIYSQFLSVEVKNHNKPSSHKISSSEQPVNQVQSNSILKNELILNSMILDNICLVHRFSTYLQRFHTMIYKKEQVQWLVRRIFAVQLRILRSYLQFADKIIIKGLELHFITRFSARILKKLKCNNPFENQRLLLNILFHSYIQTVNKNQLTFNNYFTLKIILQILQKNLNSSSLQQAKVCQIQVGRLSDENLNNDQLDFGKQIEILNNHRQPSFSKFRPVNQKKEESSNIQIDEAKNKEFDALLNSESFSKVKNRSGSCTIKAANSRQILWSAQALPSLLSDAQRTPKQASAKVKNMPYPLKFLSDKKQSSDYYQSLHNELMLVVQLKRQQTNPLFTKMSEKRQTIVLDLDETLLRSHSNQETFPSGSIDFNFNVSYDQGVQKVYTSFRPHLHFMLSQLQRHFELIVFTSGLSTYADGVVEGIEKDQQYFDHILHRDFCTPHVFNNNKIKDLAILLENRSIKDIIIVDNKPISFALHFTNGIPIKDYMGDKNDNELLSLTQYLLSFQKESDVRKKIKKDFKLDSLVQKRSNITGQDMASSCRNKSRSNSRSQLSSRKN